MKKIYIILCLLVLPIFVNAEDTFYEYYGANYYDIVETIDYAASRVISTDITYENGMYHLSGIIKNSAFKYIQYYFPTPLQDVYYTCDKGNSNQTSCEQVYAVYINKKITWSDTVLGIVLKDNQKTEDKNTFYVGKKYTYKDGIYTMSDYEEHSILEIQSKPYISHTYEKYYFCPDNFKTSCDNMIYLTSYSNNSDCGVPADSGLTIGDGYQYINGKYQIINPRKIYPTNTEERRGYTCYSKEETCDNLYYLTLGDNCDVHDGGREGKYTKVTLPSNNKIENIALLTGEQYRINQFFSDEELENIMITDDTIVEITNGTLVGKKIGKASLIYEREDLYKELVVTISEKGNEKDSEKETKKEKPLVNPKTGYKLYIIIGLLINTIGLLLYQRNKKIDY